MPKTFWDRLEARPSPGSIHVVVETPRGSRNKYKYDEKLGLFRLNRVLFAGASFPYDFGYVPDTRSGDGDPLDVLLLMDEPAFPGCVVRCRALGVLLATKEGKTNHRILAVSTDAKTWSTLRELTDLPRRLLREIEQFFHSVLNIDGREHAMLGFRGAAVAERIIDEAIDAEEARKGTARAKTAKRRKPKALKKTKLTGKKPKLAIKKPKVAGKKPKLAIKKPKAAGKKGDANRGLRASKSAR